MLEDELVHPCLDLPVFKALAHASLNSFERKCAHTNWQHGYFASVCFAGILIVLISFLFAVTTHNGSKAQQAPSCF
jgi:hypothetical protein